MRAQAASDLYSQLVAFIVCADLSAEQLNLKVLACVLLKKYYLDDRAEEKQLEQITPEMIQTLKVQLQSSLNFETEPINLLRRKAEIICKLYKKTDTYAELI